MKQKTALILVDIQNDFLPGGSLAVPQGDKIIEHVNRLIQRKDLFDIVLATQDWHPKDHVSFAANHVGKKVGETIPLDGDHQILWPVHCVQNTRGAEISSKINTKEISKIFYKGINPKVDSYSAFFDNAHKLSTGLGDYLKSNDISTVYMAGLATDYCVLFSALDSAHLGFKTIVMENACAGIDLTAGDIEKAYAKMRQAGVEVVTNIESIA